MDPTACSRCSQMLSEMNKTKIIYEYHNVDYTKIYIEPDMDKLYTLDSWKKLFNDMKEPEPFDPPV